MHFFLFGVGWECESQACVYGGFLINTVLWDTKYYLGIAMVDKQSKALGVSLSQNMKRVDNHML